MHRSWMVFFNSKFIHSLPRSTRCKFYRFFTFIETPSIENWPLRSTLYCQRNDANVPFILFYRILFETKVAWKTSERWFCFLIKALMHLKRRLKARAVNPHCVFFSWNSLSNVLISILFRLLCKPISTWTVFFLIHRIGYASTLDRCIATNDRREK